MGLGPQGLAQKGSQKWIQKLINENPVLLNDLIIDYFELSKNTIIQWVSPKSEDDYAEYRDNAFLDILDLRLGKYALSEFWPRGGPRWDALGKSTDGRVFLIEAKSHIVEMKSPPTRSSGKSKDLIQKSLNSTKAYLNVKSDVDWSKTYFQYTNRLAHLYLLRILNSISGFLIFVYFLNDVEMRGPKKIDEWLSEIDSAHFHLGIKRNKLSKFTADIFVDVRNI